MIASLEVVNEDFLFLMVVLFILILIKSFLS